MSRFLVVLSLLALAGCGGGLMQGSHLTKGIPSNIVATYKVGACLNVDDGSRVPGPEDQTYYLAEGESGLVLYEMDRRNGGTAITNHWVEGSDDHFLTYVRTSSGWEYVVPADRTRRAERLVYVAGTFKVETLDGVMRVKRGSPRFRCELVPK